MKRETAPENLQATTVALDPELDVLLSVAAEQEGVSRSEFLRRTLRLILEQYLDLPALRSAGVLRETLPERGDEGEP
jgi:hypothetical protein